MKSTLGRFAGLSWGEPPVRFGQPSKRFWSLGTIQTCNVVRQIANLSQAFSSLPVWRMIRSEFADEFEVPALLGLQRFGLKGSQASTATGRLTGRFRNLLLAVATLTSGVGTLRRSAGCCPERTRAAHY